MVADHNLTARVHFLGSRDDVLQILPHLDLFVLPSLWEGFPTVILEAMSQEIPVVATDISGSRELVEHQHTGLLVPPKDVNALAEAINFQLDHPAHARKMAQPARVQAAQFTIQNTALCFEKIYRQIKSNKATKKG